MAAMAGILARSARECPGKSTFAETRVHGPVDDSIGHVVMILVMMTVVVMMVVVLIVMMMIVVVMIVMILILVVMIVMILIVVMVIMVMMIALCHLHAWVCE